MRRGRFAYGRMRPAGARRGRFNLWPGDAGQSWSQPAQRTATSSAAECIIGPMPAVWRVRRPPPAGHLNLTAPSRTRVWGPASVQQTREPVVPTRGLRRSIQRRPVNAARIRNSGGEQAENKNALRMRNEGRRQSQERRTTHRRKYQLSISKSKKPTTLRRVKPQFATNILRSVLSRSSCRATGLPPASAADGRRRFRALES